VIAPSIAKWFHRQAEQDQVWDSVRGRPGFFSARSLNARLEYRMSPRSILTALVLLERRGLVRRLLNTSSPHRLTEMSWEVVR